MAVPNRREAAAMTGLIQGGVNEGLEQAAVFLEATAQDYDQMADKASGYTRKVEAGLLREKAILLRGQAKHIRKMKGT